ncbi:hypothetical protein P3T73_11300 [Kiritimatiellota bacterium B12222]|nr:hypothetical protein P3T73_11300 [Kiritimatiellota bacterium B12222]
MRTPTFSKPFLLLLSGILFLAWQPVVAQEEAPAEEAPAEETPAAEEETTKDTLTQGQAAVIIARRLGLTTETSGASTQARAMQLLSARGVNPTGGWDADAVLLPGDLARLLVQALGLESELSEAQIAGTDNSPYVDLLIEKYGVDVEDIVSANTLNAKGNAGRFHQIGLVNSSDPLLTADVPTGNNASDIPVSQADLEQTLKAIANENSGGQGNVTPSAP